MHPKLFRALCCVGCLMGWALALCIPAGAQQRAASPRVTGRVWPAAPGEASVCLWADDKLAAFSITIDDNTYPDVAWWLQKSTEMQMPLTWFLITDRVGTTLKVGENSAARITFTLTDTRDNTVFDYPLTVKVRLPAAWQNVAATQNSKPLEARIVEHEGGRYTLVKVVPGRGPVALLSRPEAAPQVPKPSPAPQAQYQQEITQYGITWRFDKPYRVGRFVTGDYWVVGPVQIVGVTPAPAPGQEESNAAVKSIYGAAAMQPDSRLRNGSMIVTRPSDDQGYDSRLKNYKPELSVAFPLTLQPNQSLISTVSNTTLPVQVMHHALMWQSEKNAPLALKAAAVLTCVAAAPAADAFRPAYAGARKTIYHTRDIRWELLPRLKPVEPMPNWEQFERYFERPWLDHMSSWMLQYTGPSENQVNYGREFSRLTGIASLMLVLDVPRERKQKLLYGLIQLGIDLEGLAAEGRAWSADGGHWNGRKWPILFTGLMLNEPRFQQTADAALFSEDQQTYYGVGAAGQTALYQIVLHTFPHRPYEEKPADQWDDGDKRAEGYRTVVSGGWPATALAALLMKARAAWNHDAFFDYNDRWMAKTDAYAGGRGSIPRPKAEGRSFDAFVDAMWAAYRPTVPAQSHARDRRKWEWIGSTRQGHFVPN